MVGDLLLKIKRLWKENTCIHSYKVDVLNKKSGIFNTTITRTKCSKCGRIKY